MPNEEALHHFQARVWGEIKVQVLVKQPPTLKAMEAACIIADRVGCILQQILVYASSQSKGKSQCSNQSNAVHNTNH